MRVTMMLADSAQAVAGKLYILGGGWSVMGPAATPFAIVLKIEVPWDQANRRHKWHLRLLTEDGKPVMLPVPEGEPQRALEMGSEFEVGRPPGMTPGTPLDFPFVIQFAPLMLPPGRRFEWVLSIDDQEDAHWRLAFSTRALSPQN